MLQSQDIGISAIVDTKSTNSAANSAAKVYTSSQKGTTLIYHAIYHTSQRRVYLAMSQGLFPAIGGKIGCVMCEELDRCDP